MLGYLVDSGFFAQCVYFVSEGLNTETLDINYMYVYMFSFMAFLKICLLSLLILSLTIFDNSNEIK